MTNTARMNTHLHHRPGPGAAVSIFSPPRLTEYARPSREATIILALPAGEDAFLEVLPLRGPMRR